MNFSDEAKNFPENILKSKIKESLRGRSSMSDDLSLSLKDFLNGLNGNKSSDKDRMIYELIIKSDYFNKYFIIDDDGMIQKKEVSCISNIEDDDEDKSASEILEEIYPEDSDKTSEEKEVIDTEQIFNNLLLN